MNTILFALLFFLPAGLANMSPVIANKIPLLNKFKTPLDFGMSWHKKRIFGDNKTWRGVLFGSLVAGLCSLLVYALVPDLYDNVETFVHINNQSVFVIGVALGFGALFGDAVESFFKRRSGVKPGESWFPFDQIDYILGGLLLVSLFIGLSPMQSSVIFVLYFGLHLVSAYIGYKLGLKDKPI